MQRGSTKLLMVLAFLLLAGAGALGYFFMTGEGGPLAKNTRPTATPRLDKQVVQAAIDLPAGVLISTTEVLTLAEIPGDEYAAAPKSYFLTMDELKGQKTVQDLTGGEPIQPSQVRPAGLADLIPTPAPGQPSMRAFSIQVNPLTGVADQIQSGDYVDILASFNMDVPTIRYVQPLTRTEETVTDPEGVWTQQGEGILEHTEEGNTKVLLQDIMVLQVVKAPEPVVDASATPEATPTAEPTKQSIQTPKNAAGTTFLQGNYMLVVAVTNQEAEILRFVLDRGIGMSALLRATGDHTTQRSVGATLRILADNFGLPVTSALASQTHPQPLLPLQDTQQFAPIVPTPEAPQEETR